VTGSLKRVTGEARFRRRLSVSATRLAFNGLHMVYLRARFQRINTWYYKDHFFQVFKKATCARSRQILKQISKRFVLKRVVIAWWQHFKRDQTIVTGLLKAHTRYRIMSAPSRKRQASVPNTG